mmetsp:Transcript_52182/g.86557  ORF Transcript_52182/g.86557 Transcript_52182/m.86557 type:complete len:243 (+) Transcript_52182:504-1232(+)
MPSLFARRCAAGSSLAGRVTLAKKASASASAPSASASSPPPTPSKYSASSSSALSSSLDELSATPYICRRRNLRRSCAASRAASPSNPQVSIAAGTAKKGTERKAVTTVTTRSIAFSSPSGEPRPVSISTAAYMAPGSESSPLRAEHSSSPARKSMALVTNTMKETRVSATKRISRLTKRTRLAVRTAATYCEVRKILETRKSRSQVSGGSWTKGRSTSTKTGSADAASTMASHERIHLRRP